MLLLFLVGVKKKTPIIQVLGGKQDYKYYPNVYVYDGKNKDYVSQAAARLGKLGAIARWS